VNHLCQPAGVGFHRTLGTGQIYRRSSVSTSFMLAALRVLHVDTSHALVGS
jgi:hypothetical protein